MDSTFAVERRRKNMPLQALRGGAIEWRCHGICMIDVMFYYKSLYVHLSSCNARTNSENRHSGTIRTLGYSHPVLWSFYQKSDRLMDIQATGQTRRNRS